MSPFTFKCLSEKSIFLFNGFEQFSLFIRNLGVFLAIFAIVLFVLLFVGMYIAYTFEWTMLTRAIDFVFHGYAGLFQKVLIADY